MADLINFPWERNVGKARRVAYVWLKKRTEKARKSYWSDTCGYIEWRLRERGFPQTEIDRQLAGFKSAVEWEIGTINLYNDHQQGPGAA